MWPRPRIEHPGKHGLDRLGDAEQVDLERPAERIQREVGHEGQRAVAGTGEDHVDRPEGPFDLLDGSAERCTVGDVGDLGHEPGPHRLQLVGQPVEALGIDVDQAQRHASAGQFQGRRAADPVGRARDQNVGLSTHRHTSHASRAGSDSRNSSTAATNSSGFSSGARCFAPGILRPRQSARCPSRKSAVARNGESSP